MALILADARFWLALALLGVLLALVALKARLRWRPAYGLRLLLLAILLPLILPAVQPAVETPLYTREVLALDESASIPAAQREQNREKAREWMRSAPNRLVMPFAAQSHALADAESDWPEVDERSTDLVGAVESAARLAGSGARVILASDGLAREPLAVQRAVTRLRDTGTRLDVLPLDSLSFQNDLAVESVWLPDYLWASTAFGVTVQVRMPATGQVNLRVEVDGRVAVEQAEELPAGLSTLSFALTAPAAGVMTVTARASLPGDPNPANDAAYAVARVFPPPAVLLVAEEPQAAANFALMLNASGLTVEMASPAQLPTEMAALERYQVVLLDNLLADSLSGEQISALKIFVSSLGRGLVFLGGRSAYTLGGYDNSVLEAMLPVRMQPPERQKRAPVTFVLMIDVSASMGYTTQPDQPRPIDLAREAAMRVIESMQPDDTLGIASYSDEVSWDVPLSPVGEGLNLRLAIDTASRLTPLFGTQMYRSLVSVVKSLGPAQGEEKRYLLLLSDGKSADGSLAEFSAFARLAAENGLTISTIALGLEPDYEVMAAIAEAGRGRYYPVPDARLLPKVMVNETRAAKSENVQEGQTGVKPGETSSPVLASVDLTGFPPLEGYNALRSRAEEGAEDILVSASYGDPLLSAWQYGLGRVVAWMGDAGEEWSADMLYWPQSGIFWSQVVRYALPDPGMGQQTVSVEAQDTSLEIEADLRKPSGFPANLAQPQFEWVDSGGQARSAHLEQTGPGRYQAMLDLPPAGAYRAVIRWQDGENGIELPAPFVVNLPFESRVGEPAASRRELTVWANLGGGQVIAWKDLTVMTGSAPARGLVVERNLGWLAALALAAWVVEIAARRRWLPWK